jgi:hypothetical protein
MQEIVADDLNNLRRVVGYLKNKKDCRRSKEIEGE